ncbi:MAG: metallophosphoesterase [Chitinophagaceae bacterium]|nr:metallophosphoesterase [Chitinophagaceae bacterium]
MQRVIFFLFTVSLSFAGSAQDAGSRFIVHPYLQHSTQSSIRIHWETSDSCTTQVQYGAARLNSGKPVWDNVFSIPGTRTMHHALLEKLNPETVYFYRVISILPGGDSLVSDVNTFQTSVKDSSAFAFAVFSDSQNDWKDPEAWKRVSTQAYKQRPNFAVHAGDLVDLGYMKDDWVNEFLGQGNLFMKTIPVFSIPGNHEHDAAYYYQYMYVPQPYFYSFKYGNAEFFMIDTDQYQEEGTDMYNAVEVALARSTAYWKFVVHHHPPFSSDDDDFGDTRYEASERGDTEVQSLVPLYEKYGVDIVFYGHIHTYERTWPVLNKKTVNENGVLYINTGGSGGSLENPAPTRSWFTNTLRTVHHFGYVTINQHVLQFQAIDENGNLFDQFVLNKSRKEHIKNLSPAAPVVNTGKRLFTDTMQVSLATANNTDAVYYTTDNTEPTRNSLLYSGNITLDQSTVIKTTAFNAFGKSRMNVYYFKKEKLFKAAKTKKLSGGLQYGYFTGQIADEDSTYFNKINGESRGTTPGLDLNNIPHGEQFWGAVFTGYLYAPGTGYYLFDGHADHRLRLHIHDKLLFDEKNRDINYSGEIYLEKGYHPVKIEYYNSRKNRAFIELYYTVPGMERKAVPDEAWRR